MAAITIRALEQKILAIAEINRNLRPKITFSNFKVTKGLLGSIVFHDARTLPTNTTIDSDVCIIGAGAAGITLAKEFRNQAFRVCLLESGGLEHEEETQSLYDGSNRGLPYPLRASRLRYFGGTTNHWMGSCRPLDEIDFEPRDWVPHSGWPFTKSELLPYYRRAQHILQLGSPRYEVEDWQAQATPRLSFRDDAITTAIFQHSPPTRFGQVYREEILQGRNIRTLLYANAVDIDTTASGRTVTRVHVATLEGNRFWVASKIFILAAGGIENPRLLLLSNGVQSKGLGNAHDLVGRYFMEHQEVETGVFLPANPNQPMGLYRPHRVRIDGVDVAGRGVLSLSPETMRLHRLANITFDVAPRSVAAPFSLEPFGGSDAEGVTSLRHLLDVVRKREVSQDLMKHVGNVIMDLGNVGSAVYRKMFGGQIRYFAIIADAEQVPNPESRVSLSSERDRLGKNRVQLDWRVSNDDIDSIVRGTAILGRELGRAGIGRLKMTIEADRNKWGPYYQNHHMGTTRMHVDPKKGVVDQDCRVHGISNLFVAGSSVFPTSGSATPTITIVALALRLADHVKGSMKA